jgi:hypothetical protein
MLVQSAFVRAYALTICSLALTAALLAEEPAEKTSADAEWSWQTDYLTAAQQAKGAKKLFFVWFHNPQWNQAETRFAQQTLTDINIHARLKNMVGASIPTSATLETEKGPTTVLNHPAFAEMLGLPGVAIIDFTRPGTANYGQVVTVFPFRNGGTLTGYELAQILDLPPGSLTQRTLILAVRRHGERPASTQGQVNDVLLREAESHSGYQASIRNQGHHNWDSRFHRIVGQMGGAGGAKEVCAESWPGQRLVEAAEDCVHSWRQSPGHWGAVSSYQPLFGYDMKLGSNGIWYATGIFAGGAN